MEQQAINPLHKNFLSPSEITTILDAFLLAVEVKGKLRQKLKNSVKDFLAHEKERRNFEFLLKAAVRNLGTEPEVLKKVDLILRPFKCQLVFVPDPDRGPSIWFVVRTPGDAFVISTGAVDIKGVPLDSGSLREAIRNAESDEPSLVIPNVLPSSLASALMELILYEIDHFPALYERCEVDEAHRKRCMHCLRRLSGQLSGRYSRLPPSYYIYGAARESTNPLTGGGFAAASRLLAYA
ncbi:hypothetical protein K438DRAFT_364792 [Mycena galopus ATCC 62051]|nr:hypothetical protein K438DRAFT_364792 [Mycena galopus ATCC 62051]